MRKMKIHKETDFGYIYALKDDSRPGLKIGFTYYPPYQRSLTFNSSERRKGHPCNFKVAGYVMVRLPEKAEKIVHELIGPCRIEKEFFDITVQEFKLIMKHNFTRKDKECFRREVKAINRVNLGIQELELV